VKAGGKAPHQKNQNSYPRTPICVGQFANPRQRSQRSASIPQRTRAISLFAPTVLVGAAVVVFAGVWLGAEAILNQDVAFWLSQQLSKSRNRLTSENTPQTLEQSRAGIRQAGLLPGEMVSLAPMATRFQPVSTRRLLLPVFALQPNCPENCQSIVELRIYRSLKLPYLFRLLQAEPYFQRVDQITVEGPPESQIVRPVGDLKLANYGSTRVLPLTHLESYSQGVGTGVWLNLSGLLVQGETTTSYGQIFYYNHDSARLSSVLNWSSPAGENPKWREVTGEEAPELIVNHTVGLEPKFIIYQVRPSSHAVQLQAISLNSLAKDRNYNRGLVLARSGLWSSALRWLKLNHGSKVVQAQIDLVRFHAQITRTQADQDWINPVQKSLAYLIDGRFTEALEVFQASTENSYEMGNVLQTDGDRLWNRVAAALQVNPAQPDAIAWGALILAAQQGQPEALSWLQKRAAITSSVYLRAFKVLKQLKGANAKFSSPPITSKKLLIPKPKQPLAPQKNQPNLDSPAQNLPDTPRSMPPPEAQAHNLQTESPQSPQSSQLSKPTLKPSRLSNPAEESEQR